MSTHPYLIQRSRMFLAGVLALATSFFSGCKNDDPEPVNEEELITTVRVELTPLTGDVVELTFVDLDGDGPNEPVITPETATLIAGKSYSATISFLNEAGNATVDITEEVEAERNDHLICFTISTADIAVAYNDEDASSLPVGLVTTWTSGSAGAPGNIIIALRHQPGIKTGECPGGGETDVQVTFPIQVIE